MLLQTYETKRERGGSQIAIEADLLDIKGVWMPVLRTLVHTFAQGRAR